MDLVVKPTINTFNDMKTLNGMNISKVTAIMSILIGCLFIFLSDSSKDRLHVLGVVTVAIGALWFFYTAALAFTVMADKGGVMQFAEWEWANLRDTLLGATVKMFFQFLLIFGLGLIFISEDMNEIEQSKRDKIKTLGYVCVGLSVPYFVALLVIWAKLAKK